MAILTREERQQWRRNARRQIGVDPVDLKYASINKYTCAGCGKIKYYDGECDPNLPQYHTLRKMTKLGYGIGEVLCHECWHAKGYENPLVRHNSKCRVCELAYWNRVAARKTKVANKLKEEAVSRNTKNGRSTLQVSNGSQQTWASGGVHLSKGRKHNKNSKERRSTRRRAGTV